LWLRKYRGFFPGLSAGDVFAKMIEFQNPIQDQVLEKRTPQKALYIM
jgi:hypothetical protein